MKSLILIAAAFATVSLSTEARADGTCAIISRMRRATLQTQGLALAPDQQSAREGLQGMLSEYERQMQKVMDYLAANRAEATAWFDGANSYEHRYQFIQSVYRACEENPSLDFKEAGILATKRLFPNMQ